MTFQFWCCGLNNTLFRAGYECNVDEHKCQGIPGRILIDSITIYTESCDSCSASDEGVKVTLLGKKDGNYPEGLPCHSNTLDHSDTTDFDSGAAIFDGRKNGDTDPEEKNMMGSCYEVTLQILSDKKLLIFCREP